MCDNVEIFTNDPKAVPSIVSYFARTKRKFVLRTLMLISAAPVTEKELEEAPRITQTAIETLVGGTVCTNFVYQADKKFVEYVFDSALKSVHYIIENERTDAYPMGKRLMGHIEQTILPRQFFCYDGRYYQVRSISSDTGVIV